MADKSHINHYQEQMGDLLMEVAAETHPDIATVVNQILSIQRDQNLTKTEQEQAFRDIWEGLEGQEQQVEVMNLLAKYNDMARSARKIAALDLMQAYHVDNGEGRHGRDADTLAFGLRKLEAQKYPPADAAYVQKLVDEASFSFSITAHPTNPTGVWHTTEGMRIERLLADPDTTRDQLKDALHDYLAIPVTANSPETKGKKTPEEETAEGIAILDSIYDTVVPLRHNLETALKSTRYWDEGVRVTKPPVTVNAWFAGGDGDGNPNITQSSLKDGIQTLKTRIRERYMNDLDALIALLDSDARALPETVRDRLAHDAYASPEEFIHALDELKHFVGNDAIEAIESLIYKVQTFGFHYAHIDIRHDAGSLQTTMQQVAFAAGLIPTLDTEITQAQREAWLQDAAAVDALQSVDTSQFPEGADGALAKRVVERLRLAAQHPEMAHKLIIADAATASDALNAMLLLKGTGHEIGTDKAVMQIVPLSESVEDLLNLPEVIRTLASNPEFRKHLDALGEMIVMVAESDNRRRGGMGAGAVIYDTIGKLIKLGEELHLPIHVMNGGGADLVRGAQNKPTEIGLLHGYFAYRHEAGAMHSPNFTIQGHQGRLLMSPSNLGEYILEGIYSQNLYAMAGTAYRIPRNQVDVDQPLRERYGVTDRAQLQGLARNTASIFHETAREYFSKHRDMPAFDALLEHAPWVSTKLANVSSRPSKRGSVDQLSGSTIADIKGEHPKALEQRAITGSSLLRQFGAFPLPFFGQKEGLEQALAHMNELGVEPNLMYDFSKPERNHMRALAIMMHNMEFDKSWDIILPETELDERPTGAALEALAARFDPQNTEDLAATLAYMEQYAIDTAKLAYQVIRGINPDEIAKFQDEPFALKNVLKDTWPALAQQMELMQQSLSFADFVEAELTRQYNAEPDRVMNDLDLELARATAASTLVRNTPSGILGVYTAMDRSQAAKDTPGQGLLHSSLEANHNVDLVLPVALQENATKPPQMQAG